jgi:hypothetical protein
MGQGESRDTSAGLGDTLLMTMDQYPVKLTVAQCAALYGPFTSKQCILRWSDVIAPGSRITFRKCREVHMDVGKLYNMQRDLQQWIRHRKVTVEDCPELWPWRPHPFVDFECHVGDLVVRKHVLTHAVLVCGGVTFDELWERFGLTPPLMSMIGFTPEQWIELGMKAEHVEALGNEHWKSVFKGQTREWVLEGILRKQKGETKRTHGAPGARSAVKTPILAVKTPILVQTTCEP